MIVGIVLAAGEAKRMGSVKQLLDWHGEPLIHHVIQGIVKSHFDQVRVVLGANYELIEPVIADLDVEVVYNPNYQLGQSTSVKKGLEGLSQGVKAAGFLLADQPLIRLETYNTLIEAVRLDESGIHIPTWQGQRGNPIFFGQQFFPLLQNVKGDRGGREIIRQHPDWVRLCEVDDPGILVDLDSNADYIRSLQWGRF